jgi:hypothetical protein
MTKKTIYCLNCEVEFKITYESDEELEVTHCPFCGESLEDADCAIGEY